MSDDTATGLTYDDLWRFPDDGLRRELYDGELVVTPSPVARHQWIVVVLADALLDHVRVHGGMVFPAPLDVVFSASTVLEPDVLYLRPGTALDPDGHVHTVPDISVEVLSPTTRLRDRGRKRELYERHGVPEYWVIDPDLEVVEVSVLEAGSFGALIRLTAGDVLTSPQLPGFALPIADLFAWPPSQPRTIG